MENILCIVLFCVCESVSVHVRMANFYFMVFTKYLLKSRFAGLFPFSHVWFYPIYPDLSNQCCNKTLINVLFQLSLEKENETKQLIK